MCKRKYPLAQLVECWHMLREGPGSNPIGIWPLHFFKDKIYMLYLLQLNLNQAMIVMLSINDVKLPYGGKMLKILLFSISLQQRFSTTIKTQSMGDNSQSQCIWLSAC
jgi:hypothetical protein